MFRTTREAEILRPTFVGEDMRLWSYVEHGLQLPWFYVRLVHHECGAQMSRMLMLSNVEMLKNALNQQTPSSWVDDIQFVSPGHFNKAGRWLMEPLVELIEVGAEQPKSHIFRVMGDRYYTDGQPDSAPETMTRTIYLAENRATYS
ncbi:hypothetical protein C4K18_3060 [Pseudomonas chlororaphis subsp. aurantiaca]|nr:hypothetical protein C4K18_3060 [Pseudomonas chlororaphis subsp. aurantiaca]